METYGWLLDPKRCIECRACEAACKQWNGVDTGVNVRYRQVRVTETGVFPAVRQQAISGACNHCDDAPCIKVCPTKAIWRRTEDGTVQVAQELCIGCKLCGEFCPHGAPQFHATTGKMQKCTGCFDRVEGGMQPACVTVCPTEALQWGKWSDIARRGAAPASGAWTQPRLRFVNDPYPAS
ncbi:MAG: 4Fe-4S dicluster domain-containing protein [Bryobacterales bacterium]|nr:4Fe-4S dicluster domain-containing protein [Bryobacterales bacterium]